MLHLYVYPHSANTFFLQKMLPAYMSAAYIQMHPDKFFHGSKHYEP